MALRHAERNTPAARARGLLILGAGGALIAFVGGLWTAWWTLVSPWLTVSCGIIALGLATASYRVFRWARIPSPAVNAVAALLLVGATLGTAHRTAWRSFADDLYARVQRGRLDDYLAAHGVEAWRRLGPDVLAGEYLGYVLDLGRPGGYFSYLRLRAADGYRVLWGSRYAPLRSEHRRGGWVWLDLCVDTLVVAWGILMGVVWACWTGLPHWVPFQRREPEPSTVASAARRGRWREALNLLVEGGDPNIRDGDGGPTALHYAAAAGRAAEIGRLLEAGAWLDVRDADGRTPLHWAARAGSSTALTRLLGAGFSSAAQDRSGRTPLHDAAEHGSGQAVERLLAAGADPRAWDFAGQAPSALASRAGHTRVAALLRDADGAPGR